MQYVCMCQLLGESRQGLVMPPYPFDVAMSVRRQPPVSVPDAASAFCQSSHYRLAQPPVKLRVPWVCAARLQ